MSPHIAGERAETENEASLENVGAKTVIIGDHHSKKRQRTLDQCFEDLACLSRVSIQN